MPNCTQWYIGCTTLGVTSWYTTLFRFDNDFILYFTDIPLYRVVYQLSTFSISHQNVMWSALSNLGRFLDLLSYENSFHLKRKPVDNKSAKNMKIVHHYDTQNNKLNHPGFSFSIQPWWPFCTSTFMCGPPCTASLCLWFNIQVWWPFCT